MYVACILHVMTMVVIVSRNKGLSRQKFPILTKDPITKLS